MVRWREALEKLRIWVDGEDSLAERGLEDVVRIKNSRSEEFLKRIVREINSILQDEIIRLPSGKAYIPSNFIVFLSESEDKNLRRDKRGFLEMAISELMLARAAELAGTSKLSSKTIGITLKIDGTLQDDEIKVKAVSDALRETLRNSTSVEQANLESTIAELNETIDDDSSKFNPLYYVEIWRENRKIEEFPIIKREITFGRMCEGDTANIKLKTDNRKISRLHASVLLKEDGQLLVTSLHNNPTIVDGKPITKNEKAELEKKGKLEIYEFTIKLRFGD